MNIFQLFIDFVLHLDKNLNLVIQHYGVVAYPLLFLIIFMETGFVVTPFLPGDSLLFAAGTISATSSLNIIILYITLLLAAILGDNTNYWIGRFIGPRIFQKENARFFKREYLEKTRQFYAKHGVKTIILARFIPIIRTFAPFVAGVGKMHYSQFLPYDVLGGFLWVSLFTLGGYWFGNLPVIKQNFHLAIFGIIFLSILPGLIEYIKHKRSKLTDKKTGVSSSYKSIEDTFKKQHLADH
jgi:membrane-associated protein